MKRLPSRLTNEPNDFGKVAVLMGGWSSERDISLLSGKAVLKALTDQGVNAHAVDPVDGFQQVLIDEKFDRVFIALHGRGGEDGTVQGALEFLNMPYTGSGVLGSAISMDKVRSKQLFAACGLHTPRYRQAHSEQDLPGIAEELGFPLAVKPAHEGSSIGLSKADNLHQLHEAYAVAATHDNTVLVETWIVGGEYTAAVLSDQVLPLIRIETPNVFYDFEAKYHSDSTQYHCPAGLPAEEEERLAAEVLIAFNATSTRGWGRVDFMLDENGTACFLEVNTVPGMTATSLVPMAARQIGCDFEELVWRVLETSLNAQGGS